ncbi:HAD family phosphatase [Pseudorhodobacter sp.]|uniref:HAD family hydrolase n=1 Tax=Pseudorhodobacter sp. TaxID=1934400 RepID=UPI00264A0005|nr:HAD family hydrolase [Pseudorhodobacter sp.]MDN5787356.1 HAD family hydrolase [Pseudorhodobacter sp.]
MIDLVIFDCDGVLIDSEIISARMLVAELALLGVQIDLAYVARYFLGRSYPTVMATIRQDFGVKLSPEFEETYRRRLLAIFERELKAIPHVETLLRDLAWPWCVATSSSPVRVAQSLKITGLQHLVGDRLFTASEVTNGKPAPDLFLYAAHKMGVAPARCLIVEDSLNGIKAARAAGMPVWRFTGGSHLQDDLPDEPEDARPDLRFASFSDFPQRVADFIAREKDSTA